MSGSTKWRSTSSVPQNRMIASSTARRANRSSAPNSGARRKPEVGAKLRRGEDMIGSTILQAVARGLASACGRAMTTDLSQPSMDLGAAIEFSHYAGRLVGAQPALAAAVRADIDEPFAWNDRKLGELDLAETPVALHAALRRLRREVLLRTLLRDLSGRSD